MSINKQLFKGVTDEPIWLVGNAYTPDSKILITINSVRGLHSVFVADGQIQEIESNGLLDSAQEVQQIAKKPHLRAIGRVAHYSGYAIAITLLLFSVLSFSGVVKARIVLTGSMAPAISTGDIIITTPITRKEPRVGDVVAYQAKRFNGENVAVFSHRIISGDIQSGFVVKGDANKSPDSQKPAGPDILGVVIFVIPFLGNILTPKALFLLVPCIFGLWLIMDAMKSVE